MWRITYIIIILLLRYLNIVIVGECYNIIIVLSEVVHPSGVFFFFLCRPLTGFFFFFWFCFGRIRRFFGFVFESSSTSTSHRRAANESLREDRNHRRNPHRRRRRLYRGDAGRCCRSGLVAPASRENVLKPRVSRVPWLLSFHNNSPKISDTR